MPVSRRAFVRDTCRAACAMALLPSASCARRGGATLSPNVLEYLDKRIPELLAETKVPGLSMAIVKDSTLAWRRSYGVANVETQAPIADDTIFEAGSVSKTVFAYAVLKLCDKGI